MSSYRSNYIQWNKNNNGLSINYTSTSNSNKGSSISSSLHKKSDDLIATNSSFTAKDNGSKIAKYAPTISRFKATATTSATTTGPNPNNNCDDPSLVNHKTDKQNYSSLSCKLYSNAASLNKLKTIKDEQSSGPSSLKYGLAGKQTTGSNDLLSNSNNAIQNRLITINRFTSKDELASISNTKYLQSRFLAKNSVEKSSTAYLRPSRQILNLDDKRKSKDCALTILKCKLESEEKNKLKLKDNSLPVHEILVTTRATSPQINPQVTTTASNQFPAIVNEKKIIKNKSNIELVDKCIQTDSLKETSQKVPKLVTKPKPKLSLCQKNSSSSKTVSNSNDNVNSKQLPPPIPSSPPITTNKDFRKSILNMNNNNNELKTVKKSTSSDTDIDESLSKIASSRSTISPSTDISSASTISSSIVNNEFVSFNCDENKKLKKLQYVGTKKLSSSVQADECLLSNEKSIKPPPSPRIDSKVSFNRSFTTISNFAKSRKVYHNSDDNINWMESNSNNNTSDDISDSLQKDTIQSSNNSNSAKVPVYRLRRMDSSDKPWWLDENAEVPEGIIVEDKVRSRKCYDTDEEKPWWLSSNKSDVPEGIEVLSNSIHDLPPLEDRASPDGLEMPKFSEKTAIFISSYSNIDDLLGGSACAPLSPLFDRIYRINDVKEIDACQVKIHDSTAQIPTIEPSRIDVINGFNSQNNSSGYSLDDAALQLYKDGDYGAYLDLEASISEQHEEFDGFNSSRKDSIVLRTQLSVRVHTIIEKLLNSEGRELRRALFSLKQIFQEDKDLVHEFVQNDGLTCLIRVGSEADQNYQNYILRALGQVMLYVDGMNGVIEHNATVQWLYKLISSKFRLVVKTALKLLLVFVEYSEKNCLLLIKAVQIVDKTHNLLPWYNIMKLLKDFDAADTELLIYATTLINKCLNGVPDQDTYYDQTDALEEQGIENIIQKYMTKQGTDLDLLQQFQIYEAVLQHEDGNDNGFSVNHFDESIRKTLRNRKSVTNSLERRKSRRHSIDVNRKLVDSNSPVNSQNSNGTHFNGNFKCNDVGVTPALRRRRERVDRQKSFIREQFDSPVPIKSLIIKDEYQQNGNGKLSSNGSLSSLSSQSSQGSLKNDQVFEENGTCKKWSSLIPNGTVKVSKNSESDQENECAEPDRRLLIQLKRENTVKDLTQKLANHCSSEEGSLTKINRIGDMSGLISKAKEGLAKSKSKADLIKSPTSENVSKIPVCESKKSETELRWEELVNSLKRPLNLCDIDFTDLNSDDEVNILAPASVTNNTLPPPPPPLIPKNITLEAPPPPPSTLPINHINNRLNNNYQKFNYNSRTLPNNLNNESKLNGSTTLKKNKKTVKLFWKEVRNDPIISVKLQKTNCMIWDELVTVSVDTQKLEHLFESRAKDLISKKQQEMNKNKEIIVLDHKRSNAINIGMTKLPPPRSIKTAILKMDATIMNREGIEKLLLMLPTEEERMKIQEAQTSNPDVPLGSAEQFLLTLASISELPARLKLWAFKLDFENVEREIAEPLMDLKQGIELLRVNRTFRAILSTLLSIGNFLNGAEVKGFQIEYLAKVPEVKDTVHKHSLLHHLCHIVMEKFPDATDLYSEIGAITRASKIDFDELALSIHRLENDCKASWDHLKLIAKHDGSMMMKVKMSDFLTDCAERIILLNIIHRRIINRYQKFLLWLGIPLHRVSDFKPHEFCRIVSEFSLEYRTTRERVLQQLEKKANHRERNKTRGKMITEVGKFKTKEDRADAELKQLLGSDLSDVESMQGTLTWRRQRKEGSRVSLQNGNLTDADDEILETLVKTATKAPQIKAEPRERKRTRHADRKSLKRSRTRDANSGRHSP